MATDDPGMPEDMPVEQRRNVDFTKIFGAPEDAKDDPPPRRLSTDEVHQSLAQEWAATQLGDTKTAQRERRAREANLNLMAEDDRKAAASAPDDVPGPGLRSPSQDNAAGAPTDSLAKERHLASINSAMNDILGTPPPPRPGPVPLLTGPRNTPTGGDLGNMAATYGGASQMGIPARPAPRAPAAPPPAPTPVAAPAAPLHPAVKAYLQKKLATAADFGTMTPGVTPPPAPPTPLPIPRGAPPKETPPPEDPLLAAQREARQRLAYERLGDDERVAANIMTGGLKYADAGIDRGQSERVANIPVANVLQQRQAAAQAVQDKAASDIHDPNSYKSRFAKHFALTNGLAGPEDVVTADMLDDLRAGLSAKQIDEKNKRDTAADARGERHMTLQDQQAAASLAELKRWHDMENAARLEQERGKGEKQAGPKPIAAQELVKLKNSENALRGVDQLTEAYKGATAIGPSGGRYEDLRAQMAPTIAAADSPTARENTGLIKNALEQTPDRFTRDSRGVPQLQHKRQQLLDDYKGQVEALRSGGFDVSGLHPEQFEQPAAASSAPASNSTKPGKVLMVDPDGKRGYIPAAEAAEALQHGWKQG